MASRLTRDQQALLDILPDACAVVGPDGTILAVNQFWKQFVEDNGGDRNSYYVGSNYITTCTAASGEGKALSSAVAKGLTDVLAAGDMFQCEYPCHSPTQRRWFEVFIRPFYIGDDRCAVVMHRNITIREEQKITIQAAKVVANELAALVATSTDPIISMDLDGRIVSWNHAAEELYGYQAQEIVGQSMELLYPSGWPMKISDYIDGIVTGELKHFEVVRRTKAGDLRDVAISAAPIRDAHGAVTAISNIHRDITEQKRQAQHQKTIAQELAHRTKNMLAVIMSIERQTAKRAGSVAEFHDQFSRRIQGLLASNELLIAGNWISVPLHDLVKSQVSTFADANSDRIEIEGPLVHLDAQAVQPLGMSFHELATNALKHGALTQPVGKLKVSWNMACKNGSQMLTLTWEETDLTIARVPDSRGFGHVVLTTLAEQSFSTAVNYEIGTSGVLWSIDLPDTFYSLACQPENWSAGS